MTSGSARQGHPVAISIVTISKDDPDGLRATIESVLSQDFGDFELILVRSGNSQSLDLPADDRLVVIDQPAQGISRAFNSGIACARGEWVQFLNGGDVFLGDEALARLSAATRDDIQMVLSFARVDGRSFTIPRRALRCGRDSFYYASHQASLFRRVLFDRFGGFAPEIKVRMDLEWLTRLPRSTPFGFAEVETVRFDTAGVSGNLVTRSSMEETRILWRHAHTRARALEVLFLLLPFRLLRHAWRRLT